MTQLCAILIDHSWPREELQVSHEVPDDEKKERRAGDGDDPFLADGREYEKATVHSESATLRAGGKSQQSEPPVLMQRRYHRSLKSAVTRLQRRAMQAWNFVHCPPVVPVRLC